MLDFDAYVRECVVRVSGPSGVGTGFWVLKGYCITCLHNILKDRRQLFPSFPRRRWLNFLLPRTWLAFLLLRKKRDSQKHLPSFSIEYKGNTFRAVYREDLSHPEEDIAVLEIAGAEAECVPLGKTSFE